MPECNIDEIMRQLKVLDSLKDLQSNMDNTIFQETFPELVGMGSRLGDIIMKQETTLQEKLGECGSMNLEELSMPELELPELPELPMNIEELPEYSQDIPNDILEIDPLAEIKLDMESPVIEGVE